MAREDHDTEKTPARAARGTDWTLPAGPTWLAQARSDQDLPRVLAFKSRVGKAVRQG